MGRFVRQMPSGTRVPMWRVCCGLDARCSFGDMPAGVRVREGHMYGGIDALHAASDLSSGSPQAMPALGLTAGADTYNALIWGCSHYGQNASVPKVCAVQASQSISRFCDTRAVRCTLCRLHCCVSITCGDHLLLRSDMINQARQTPTVLTKLNQARRQLLWSAAAGGAAGVGVRPLCPGIVLNLLLWSAAAGGAAGVGLRPQLQDARAARRQRHHRR